MTEPDEYDQKNDWASCFTLPRFLLLLALLILAEYPEVVFGSHSFFAREFGLFSYPAAHYARESLLRGEIPLWNPLNDCGTPFLAQWSTMVGYPLSFLYLLLPLPWSLNFFCLVHLLIAGATMYALAYRWTQNRFAASLAGLAFALSGLMINLLAFPHQLAALAWLPLVILCLQRAWTDGKRQLAVAALVGAVQMLAGSPEIIALTWLLAASLWAGSYLLQPLRPTEKSLVRFLAVGAAVLGICAFQLLPFFELLQNSDILAGAGRDTAALPLWGFANLLVPLFRCQPAGQGVWAQFDQSWTSSYYLGIGVVTLALAAVWSRETRSRWLVAVAVLGLVLASGDEGHLFYWLKHAIPYLGAIHQPLKFIVLTAFALPLLAAYVVNNADQPDAKNFRLLRGSLWATGSLVLLAVIMILFWGDSPPANAAGSQTVLWNGVTRAVLLVLIVAGVLFLNRLAALGARRWLGLAILILVGVDLLTHTPRQNPVVTDKVYLGESPVKLTPLPRFGRSRAMVSHTAQATLANKALPDPLTYCTEVRAALYGDGNLLDGVPKVNGLYPLSLAEFAAVRSLLYEPTNFVPGLTDFLGVEQITATGELFRWNARKTFMPLVSAGQLPLFASRTNTLQAIGSPEFNPRRVVYLPEEIRRTVLVTNASTVEIAEVTVANRTITARVNAPHPALVVVAQSHYPCWRAFVDGEETPLLLANGAFQALQVPAGEHDVKVVYADRMFSWGLFLSLASLLACLARLTAWHGNRHVPLRPASKQAGQEVISRIAS